MHDSELINAPAAMPVGGIRAGPVSAVKQAQDQARAEGEPQVNTLGKTQERTEGNKSGNKNGNKNGSTNGPPNGHAEPRLASPSQNHLLAKLPAALLARLSSRLELIPMPLGAQLYGPGEPLRYAYFPITAIVSLHYLTAAGSSFETASVGNEGLVGLTIFMGDGSSWDAAVVQTRGEGFRLPRSILYAEFEREPAVRSLLLRYTQSIATQFLLNAACNRHHLIEQQLARLLLRTLDRLPSQDMVVTQELLANMLGVRREGITEAAGRLQAAGIIQYRRGHVSVLDRVALETRACECYRVIKAESTRLDNCAA